MGYLKEFLKHIDSRDFHKFLVLWEEYCSSDSVDVEELSQLLKTIKASEMAKPFGQVVEMALPLWRTIKDKKESYDILRLLIDLETTNSPELVDVTMETLKSYHGQDPKFNERLRLIGLRTKENFQGALSKYDLVAHMNKGNMVFHTGGWGTGEIIEVSFIREHLVIEFENVSGRKDLSFANAFKTLIPLPDENFLARRFADPDLLEQDGKENPAELVKLLLRDLGPKTAAEIKDELCELVIPEKDWTKWWQGARAKLKKDPMVETPESIKDVFSLRKVELSTEERLQNAIQSKTEVNDIIQTTYNFVRDTPNLAKNPESKQKLQNRLIDLLQKKDLTEAQRIQTLILLEQFFSYQSKEFTVAQHIQSSENIEEVVENIDILALKKRVLVGVKEFRKDWAEIFLSLLFSIQQAQLRDYLLKELNQGATKPLLEKQLQELLHKPSLYPDMCVWYFQKIVQDGEKDIPYSDKDGQCHFFESFLVLYHYLENQPKYRDLLKKMYGMLSGKRYALVRQLLQGTSLSYTKEFLLLASKCQSLTDHDMKILRSLAEVVHPQLAPPKQRRGAQGDSSTIWTTEEGYLKTQERIRQIGTVEMVENAREIEAARALGDLRENSEFKFAQERRARLQAELKTLSDQLNRARIITKEDIHPNEVGVGSIVEVADGEGKTVRYSILGPWDANPDDNILSFHSKFAQAMMGRKKGETFEFKDEEFQIVELNTYLS
jgi:transcription elongation factor GreA-like protein/transcription elongation GreA/GreB family factor